MRTPAKGQNLRSGYVPGRVFSCSRDELLGADYYQKDRI